MATRLVSVTCPVCDGGGRAIADLITCGNCNGRGTVQEEIVIRERRDTGDAGGGCVIALLIFAVVSVLVLAYAVLRAFLELLLTQEGRSKLGKLALFVILALVVVGIAKLAIDPEHTLADLGLVSHTSIWYDGTFHEIIPRPYNFALLLLSLIPFAVLYWGQTNHRWLTESFQCIGSLLSSMFDSLGQGWNLLAGIFDF